LKILNISKTKKTVLIALALSTLLLALSEKQFTMVHVTFAADSYGSDINFVEIHQWNGTAYVLKDNLTATGGSVRVVDTQIVKFIVNVKFNDTLATDTTEAVSYTRIYMNISESVWTNAELNNTSCSSSGGFYWIEEEGVWNQTGKPEAGVTYECTVLYQGYY
jgi:hypothetical protein